MTEQLREETQIYNLLRHIFLKEPSGQLILGIAEIILPEEAEGMLFDGLRMMIAGVRDNCERLDTWLEELAVEYARLFIGPGKPAAVPYASFYLSESHALMTEDTIAVRQAYLDAGMQVRSLHSIPDDHVGTELEFLFYLTERIIQFDESGLDEEAGKYFEMRERFLRKHCARWFALFADCVADNTISAFYRGAALMLKQSVIENEESSSHPYS